MGIQPILMDRDGLSTQVPDCPRIQGLGELLELARGTLAADVQ